jgi:hypothetical protein
VGGTHLEASLAVVLHQLARGEEHSRPPRAQRRVHRRARARLLRLPARAALRQRAHLELDRLHPRADLQQLRELVAALADVRAHDHQPRLRRLRTLSRGASPLGPKLRRAQQRARRDGRARRDQRARGAVEHAVAQATAPLRLSMGSRSGDGAEMQERRARRCGRSARLHDAERHHRHVGRAQRVRHDGGALAGLGQREHLRGDCVWPAGADGLERDRLHLIWVRVRVRVRARARARARARPRARVS